MHITLLVQLGCKYVTRMRQVFNQLPSYPTILWWRHQMETFSALLALCAGKSPVTDEFPSQRPVTRSFGVFFDQRLNKCLSKHSWGSWFETPSHPLWRRCNDYHDSSSNTVCQSGIQLNASTLSTLAAIIRHPFTLKDPMIGYLI